MLGDPAIVLRNRFPVFLQPAAFLVGPNEAAQALLQGFRDADVHAPRFVEQLDITEQIDGAFLSLPRAHQSVSLSLPRTALRRFRSVRQKPVLRDAAVVMRDRFAVPM